jgi:hypothetical protein
MGGANPETRMKKVLLGLRPVLEDNIETVLGQVGYEDVD